MAIIFGVDSTTPANKRLTNGYRLYDWVMRQNSFPAFWGRALTGEDRIEEEELAFLREKNCKVALILRDLTEAGVSASDGMEDGLRAVEAAKALAAEIEAGKVELSIKTGEGGRTFGSVSSKEIAEAVKAQMNLDVDKKKIQMKEPIKSLGVHLVAVKLHPQVTAELKVHVGEA